MPIILALTIRSSVIQYIREFEPSLEPQATVPQNTKFKTQM